MEILLIAAGCILTILTTFLGERLFKWLNQRIRSENVRNILRHIKNIVLDNVKATQQCCVDKLKEAKKFDEKEHQRILELTKVNIINSLSEKTQIYIKNIYGDLDKFIICQIEATIYDLKNENEMKPII